MILFIILYEHGFDKNLRKKLCYKTFLKNVRKLQHYRNKKTKIPFSLCKQVLNDYVFYFFYMPRRNKTESSLLRTEQTHPWPT